MLDVTTICDELLKATAHAHAASARTPEGAFLGCSLSFLESLGCDLLRVGAGLVCLHHVHKLAEADVSVVGAGGGLRMVLDSHGLESQHSTDWQRSSPKQSCMQPGKHFKRTLPCQAHIYWLSAVMMLSNGLGDLRSHSAVQLSNRTLQGDLRFHPSVNPSIINFLGFEQLSRMP